MSRLHGQVADDYDATEPHPDDVLDPSIGESLARQQADYHTRRAIAQVALDAAYDAEALLLAGALLAPGAKFRTKDALYVALCIALKERDARPLGVADRAMLWRASFLLWADGDVHEPAVSSVLYGRAG